MIVERRGRTAFAALGACALLAAWAAGAGGPPLAVRGGTIHTITGPVLKDADLIVQDGKITAIGTSLPVPPGARTIEARGKIVLPGFVLAQEISSFSQGSGTPPEGIDVFSMNMQLALSGGVTAASVRGHVVKMTYGDPAGLVLEPQPELRFPAGSWAGRQELRTNLVEARAFLRDLSIFEQAQKEGKPAKQPGPPPGGDAFVRLLRGEVPARVDADRAQDILRYVSLAREFGFRLIIEGGLESWTVAEEIGRAQATVVLSVRQITEPPRDPDGPPGSNERVAAILRRAGVPFALVPPASGIVLPGGFAGRDITAFAMEAAFAVRGGLDEAAALAAITIEPAKILGVAHRIGSLDVGKDGDVLVLDGDPLSWKSFVEFAIINGTVYYDRSKSDLLPR